MRRAALGIGLLAIFALGIAAQSPDRVRFEVASVKVADPNAPEVLDLDRPEMVRISDPFFALVHMAYAVPNGRLSGGPSWTRTTKFEIVAKSNRPATFKEKMAMLQALLTDRFKLKWHRETKPGQVYALMLANGDGRLGPNIHPTSPECAALFDVQERDVLAAPPPQNCFPVRGRIIGGSGVTISNLAATLSARTSQTVIDRTGMTGRYDISLSPAFSGLTSPSTVDSNVPSLFSILQEQLGLKLVPQQGEIESFVIDSVEMPTPD